MSSIDDTRTASGGDDTLPASHTGAGTRGAAIGRYVLLGTIGEGGGGVVLRAYDPELDRRVAIKLLHDGEPERLVREAQALARLSHPNVVHVHDVGTHDGAVFLAMELLDGETVAEWLKTPRSRGAILGVFAQAARGLQAAHDAGLIHRDVKPHNLMLGADGRVRVVDFGLARGAAADDVPEHGILAGTPAYLSPEQARLEPLTSATDQFSLCIGLYQALWGTHPFPGQNTTELIDAIAKQPPREPPAGAPAALRRLVMRGLAADPARRHPSMTAIADALDRLRERRWTGAVVGGVAVAAVASIAIWRLASPAPSAPCRAGPTAWTDDARARLAQQFAASGHPDGAAVADAIAAKLDGHVAAWRTARVASCRATHVDHTQSPALMDRRTTCLDSIARELDTVVGVWTSTPDRARVDAAREVVAGLTSPDACAADRVLARPEEPDDAATAKARALLDRADALALAGDHAQSGTVAGQALALDAPAQRARGLFLAGQAAIGNGSYDQAEVHLFDAVEAAGATGRDDLLAQALVRLVFLDGERLGRYDEALRLTRIARAAIARAPDDPLLRAELLHNEGSVLQRTGRLDESEARLRESLALRRAAHAPYAVVSALQTLGNTFEKGDRLDDAEAVFLEARALLEQLGDAGGAQTRAAANNLAMIYARRGERARAVAEWQRVYTDEARARGDDHPELIFPLANMAWASLEDGQLDAADDFARRAAELYTARGMGDHPFVGNVELVRSYVAVARKRPDEALAHLDVSEPRLIGASTEPSEQLGQLLALRGDAHAQAGRIADAAAAYARSLEVYAQLEAPGAWRARPLLGQARLATGRGDRESAARLLGEARTLLDGAPANFDIDRAVLREILAETAP